MVANHWSKDGMVTIHRYGLVLAQMSERRRGVRLSHGGNKGVAVLNGNVISGTRSCLCAGMQHYDMFFHAFVNNWSIIKQKLRCCVNNLL